MTCVPERRSRSPRSAILKDRFELCFREMNCIHNAGLKHEVVVALMALSLFKLCERHKELSQDDFEMDPQVVKKRVIAEVRRGKKPEDKTPAKNKKDS